jgi:hypothetical protein
MSNASAALVRADQPSDRPMNSASALSAGTRVACEGEERAAVRPCNHAICFVSQEIASNFLGNKADHVRRTVRSPGATRREKVEGDVADARRRAKLPGLDHLHERAEVGVQLPRHNDFISDRKS